MDIRNSGKAFTEKEQEYMKYIEEHMNNVAKVWEDMQPTLVGEFSLFNDHRNKLIDQILAHDLSKYSSEEFDAYRAKFFPEKDGSNEDSYKQLVKERFVCAWNHHQKSNPHHWQYWIMWAPEGSTILEMPFEYMFEMLCDWTAMSYKFKDTPIAFWKKNKDTMLLHEKTIKSIERWLPLFDAIAKIHNEGESKK